MVFTLERKPSTQKRLVRSKKKHNKKHPCVILPVDKLRFIDILTAVRRREPLPSAAYVKRLSFSPEPPPQPSWAACQLIIQPLNVNHTWHTGGGLRSRVERKHTRRESRLVHVTRRWRCIQCLYFLVAPSLLGRAEKWSCRDVSVGMWHPRSKAHVVFLSKNEMRKHRRGRGSFWERLCVIPPPHPNLPYHGFWGFLSSILHRH